MQNFDEQDIPYYQIMDAFLEQYQKETEKPAWLLEIAHEMEHNPSVAIEFPHIAKYLEKHSVEDLKGQSITLAIASSVAKAIVEADRILH